MLTLEIRQCFGGLNSRRCHVCIMLESTKCVHYMTKLLKHVSYLSTFPVRACAYDIPIVTPASCLFLGMVALGGEYDPLSMPTRSI